MSVYLVRYTDLRGSWSRDSFGASKSCAAAGFTMALHGDLAPEQGGAKATLPCSCTAK